MIEPAVVDGLVSFVAVAAVCGYSESCRCFRETWSAGPVAPWDRPGR